MIDTLLGCQKYGGEKVKKRTFLILAGMAALLAACEEQEIYYNGQQRPVSEVEEIIADELEVENPELDLELNIYEESED